jgi:hypothetical protein
MQQLQLTFITDQVRPTGRKAVTETARPVRQISEARRAYLRRYYEANKEKAREYQRRYNLMHKKKVRLADSRAGAARLRQAYRETFNASDIMQAPTEKSVRILQWILNGERYFTM